MYPRLARLRLVKLRFTRLRSANPFFRDLLMTLDRRCRYSLSLAFCAESAARSSAVKDSFNTIMEQTKKIS